MGEPGISNQRRDRARRLIEGLASLTGFRVGSASAERLPRELLEREVPDPEMLVRTYRGELEPRTHNALYQSDPGRPGEAWTIGRLLAIRGFGIYSLLDLLTVLRDAASPAGTTEIPAVGTTTRADRGSGTAERLGLGAPLDTPARVR